MSETKKPALTREMAVAELEIWFSKKKIRESQKQLQKDSVDALLEIIQDGDLVLNQETNELVYTLAMPEALGDSNTIKELKFKSRLSDVILKPFLVGNTPGNSQEMMLSYLAALTDVPKTILAKLDTADKRIGQSIVVFFL